ncbi:hypothetical protein J22TS3_16390 [Paenibacillus sp. J22TS3]|nr:hypothetical protein J22TS3_16390 [Paenibacillus sp. J22TS3]
MFEGFVSNQHIWLVPFPSLSHMNTLEVDMNDEYGGTLKKEGELYLDNSVKGGRGNVSLYILHSSRYTAILAHSPS